MEKHSFKPKRELTPAQQLTCQVLAVGAFMLMGYVTTDQVKLRSSRTELIASIKEHEIGVLSEQAQYVADEILDDIDIDPEIVCLDQGFVTDSDYAGFVVHSKTALSEKVPVLYRAYDNEIFLNEQICQGLLHYNATEDFGSVKISGEDLKYDENIQLVSPYIAERPEYDQAVQSVHVLAHEYSHLLLKTPEEDRVECAALALTSDIIAKHSPHLSQEAFDYYKATSIYLTNELDREYRSEHCYKGGEYDIYTQDINYPLSNPSRSWLPEQEHLVYDEDSGSVLYGVIHPHGPVEDER